jgi:hypothetical protein
LHEQQPLNAAGQIGPLFTTNPEQADELSVIKLTMRALEAYVSFGVRVVTMDV